MELDEKLKLYFKGLSDLMDAVRKRMKTRKELLDELDYEDGQEDAYSEAFALAEKLGLPHCDQ